jgi:hypothetical protein
MMYESIVYFYHYKQFYSPVQITTVDRMIKGCSIFQMLILEIIIIIIMKLDFTENHSKLAATLSSIKQVASSSSSYQSSAVTLNEHVSVDRLEYPPYTAYLNI